MAKITYRTKEGEEYFIEADEEAQVIRLLRQIKHLNQPSPRTSISEAIDKKTEKRERFSLPRDKDVETFLLSQPNYEHDLFMVQKHFFNRTFPSRRETAPMYHRTIRQLRLIRQKIEKEKGVKFREEISDGNYKHYKIEPKKEEIIEVR
jgi:hypothetical protein